LRLNLDCRQKHSAMTAKGERHSVVSNASFSSVSPTLSFPNVFIGNPFSPQSASFVFNSLAVFFLFYLFLPLPFLRSLHGAISSFAQLARSRCRFCFLEANLVNPQILTRKNYGSSFGSF
jgi:hypothetical protein